MAITEHILSMDEYFRFTEGDKIIINHLTYMDSDDMEFIQKRLVTVYSGDTLSVMPACDCGVTKGRYLIGIECPECSSKCIDPRDKTNPILWFNILDESLLFINPVFWNSLSALLPGKLDVLRWLCDVRYNPRNVIPNYAILAKEEIMGGVRNYDVFVNNLGAMLNYFINSTELKSKGMYNKLIALKNIYANHKEDILSHYLPVLNKKLFVVENTTKGKYTNLVLGDVTDVITIWLKASSEGMSYKNKAHATGIVVRKLADLYIKYYDKFLIKKPGAFRKHLYGARSHFTFRTVISATKGKHKHNEVTPPWVIALTTYRPHMMNKLIKRGYNYKDADTLLNKSIMSFDPVLSEIQDELIAESPHEQGLPLIVNRNQHMGSSL